MSSSHVKVNWFCLGQQVRQNIVWTKRLVENWEHIKWIVNIYQLQPLVITTLQKLHVSMFEACQAHSTCAFRILFFFSHLTFQQSHKLVFMFAWIYRKQRRLLTHVVLFSPHRNEEAEYNQKLSNINYAEPFLCHSFIQLLHTTPRLHLSLLRR